MTYEAFATCLRKSVACGRRLRFLRIAVVPSIPANVTLLCAAASVFLFGQGVSTHNMTPAPRAAPSGKPFAVTLTDVAPAAGLKPRIVSGGELSKKYIIEANGSGIGFLDADQDGWLDVFVVNGSRLEGFAEGGAPSNYLFRNQQDGTFADVTAQSGLKHSGWGNGVCAGDFDNDGFEDLYVTYWGPNVLYRGLGKAKFADVTQRAGVAGSRAEKEWSSGCTFLDYDRDGRLDIFVTSYQRFDLASAPLPGKGSTCEWKGMPVFCGPRGLPFGHATLYHNRGDGSFEDVTKAAGIASVEGYYAFTPIAADLNGDGWTDIYVACDSTPSLFFRNNRDGTFSDIATETAVAYSEHGFEQGGMGVGVGDFNNDGWLDLIKTNFAGDYPNLYINTGGGIFEDVVLRAGLAINPQYVGWGVGFVDLDNDGLVDVFQANGHVYPELDRHPGGEAYRQQRLVYRNLGNGRFEDVSAGSGPGVTAKASSRGAAFGDFDNDGDIDVLILNMGEGVSLLRNDQKSGNHWLRVRLQGTRSNRDAIGATVTIEAGGMKQAAAALSQSSFLSQSDRRLHFGLGKADTVERITVKWPSGESDVFSGIKVDQEILLKEGSTGK